MGQSTRLSILAAVLASIHSASAAAPMPRALLINLPKHTERYEKVRQQLQSADIPYEKAPACDGKLLSDEEMKANVTFFGRRFLTRGMIGCFLSHRACWQHCAADGNGRGGHWRWR